MFNLTFINILFVVWAAVINVSAADDLEAAWKKYQVEFPMKIQSKSEHGLRKSIFSETHTMIKEHNSKKGASFEMAHNAFSVMTEEEKQSYFGAIKPVPPANVTRISSSLRQFPADIDFRENGCLPPVRRQGCGDCWAFSATSIVEFGKCKKNGRKGLDFSEQQLVDCTYGNDYNCANGGSEEAAWQYLASNGGQVHETSYPYTAKAGPCKACPSCGMVIGAKISSDNPVQWIASNDVNAMKSVLVEGRMIGIYIQVPNSFFNYKTGLFDDVQCVPSNAHGMAVIGYSRGYWKFNVPLWKFEWQNSEHWIVRNSWGTGWGEGGYIRIKIGVNLCGIESIPRTTNVLKSF